MEIKKWNNHNTISDLFLILENLNIRNSVKQWLKRKYLTVFWQWKITSTFMSSFFKQFDISLPRESFYFIVSFSLLHSHKCYQVGSYDSYASGKKSCLYWQDCYFLLLFTNAPSYPRLSAWFMIDFNFSPKRWVKDFDFYNRCQTGSEEKSNKSCVLQAIRVKYLMILTEEREVNKENKIKA